MTFHDRLRESQYPAFKEGDWFSILMTFLLMFEIWMNVLLGLR